MSRRSDARIDQLGAANRWGKRTAPLLATMLAFPPVARGVRLLETYLAILQGKGAGSGWGLQGEVEAAARSVRTAQPLIVDAGANVGAWTLAIDEWLAPLHPCYLLIEPSTHCLPALQGLPLRYFDIVHAAVGKFDGEAELISNAAGSEAASLHLRRDTYHQYAQMAGSVRATEQGPKSEALRERVAVRSLDSLAAERDIPHINLLKLDVEGNEFDALLGAKRLLGEKRVDAICFEFGSAHINSRVFFHDLWDLLHPLGYTIHRIMPGGGLLPVTSYYEDLEHFRGVSNYIAVSGSVTTLQA